MWARSQHGLLLLRAFSATKCLPHCSSQHAGACLHQQRRGAALLLAPGQHSVLEEAAQHVLAAGALHSSEKMEALAQCHC